MNVQRAYKLQTVNGQLLPQTSGGVTFTGAILTLYLSGVMSWATSYAGTQPVPDVGRYTFDETATNETGGTFTTHDVNGNQVGVGVMNDDVVSFVAGGETWVLTRMAAF